MADEKGPNGRKNVTQDEADERIEKRAAVPQETGRCPECGMPVGTEHAENCSRA
jgi:hypothetical protein